jgi:uncharacterized protein YbbC (DUF1343 family)
MRKLYSILLLLTISTASIAQKTYKTGAEQLDDYLYHLNGKRVGLVVNQSSLVGETHLLDTLLSSKVNVTKIFAPEHGFRGNKDAGEVINDTLDLKTGLPIVSLYGSHYKPTKKDLSGLDIIIFDIQDVGVRFYTYLSTMHYVMQSCAEQGLEMYVLDRPNPNAYYIDGPILDTLKYQSFVGMHPVPIVYGMTIGEYARMINGENWIQAPQQCKLKVIPLRNYTHNTQVELTVPPSPNLNTGSSIIFYPSLCLFEGTVMSVGRGTTQPFTFFGHPNLKGLEMYPDSIQPVSIPGMSKNPPYMGETVYGIQLGTNDVIKTFQSKSIQLDWLINAYRNYSNKDVFFSAFFDKLAGSEHLRQMIVAGLSEEQIKGTWKLESQKFFEIRKKYLLYP